MKVGNSAGSSEYLLAQGLSSAWVVNLEGAPQPAPAPAPAPAPVGDVKFLNTGVYIPNKSIKAVLPSLLRMVLDPIKMSLLISDLRYVRFLQLVQFHLLR